MKFAAERLFHLHTTYDNNDVARECHSQALQAMHNGIH